MTIYQLQSTQKKLIINLYLNSQSNSINIRRFDFSELHEPEFNTLLPETPSHLRHKPIEPKIERKNFPRILEKPQRHPLAQISIPTLIEPTFQQKPNPKKYHIIKEKPLMKPPPPIYPEHLNFSPQQFETLDFSTLTLGTSKQLEFRARNPKPFSCVFELFVTAPFHLPTRRVSIKPNSYMNFPVIFRPVRSGVFNTFIVVKFGNDIVKVKCNGSCK